MNKALEIIQDQIKMLENQLDIPGICVSCIEHQLDDLKIVEADLLRNKLKKVIVKNMDYYCPSCNRKLSRRTKYHFCPKKDCGQALDWSEKDE